MTDDAEQERQAKEARRKELRRKRILASSKARMKLVSGGLSKKESQQVSCCLPTSQPTPQPPIEPTIPEAPREEAATPLWKMALYGVVFLLNFLWNRNTSARQNNHLAKWAVGMMVVLQVLYQQDIVTFPQQVLLLVIFDVTLLGIYHSASFFSLSTAMHFLYHIAMQGIVLLYIGALHDHILALF